MANSLVKCLDRMMEAATRTKSGIKNICQPVGDAGTRCFPHPTHDPKIGGRLDLGNQTDGGKKRRLKFQVNKNAENATLKGMAAKDCHKVYATVDVDTNQAATAENAKNVFEKLKKEVKG